MHHYPDEAELIVTSAIDNPPEALDFRYGPMPVVLEPPAWKEIGLASPRTCWELHVELIVDALACSWRKLNEWLYQCITEVEDPAEAVVDIAAALRDHLRPLAVEVTLTCSADHCGQAEYTAAFATEEYLETR